MNSKPSLDPQITLANDRITYRSAIRFRLHPESADLAQRLRRSRDKQVYLDTESVPLAHLRKFHERTAVWPLPGTDEWAVFEMSFSGPKKYAPQLRDIHDMHVAAMLGSLNENHGPAAILLQGDWLRLDPDVQPSGE